MDGRRSVSIRDPQFSILKAWASPPASDSARFVRTGNLYWRTYGKHERSSQDIPFHVCGELADASCLLSSLHHDRRAVAAGIRTFVLGVGGFRAGAPPLFRRPSHPDRASAMGVSKWRTDEPGLDLQRVRHCRFAPARRDLWLSPDSDIRGKAGAGIGADGPACIALRSIAGRE